MPFRDCTLEGILYCIIVILVNLFEGVLDVVQASQSVH